MDYELIWWIVAAVVCYGAVFFLTRERPTEDVYDPYRYCPKENDDL